MSLGPLARVRAALARRRHLRSLAGRKLLDEFARIHPYATFVEIGANDGVSNDHLRPYVMRGGWRGVMVEPIPALHERLRSNYAGFEGVATECAAISKDEGEISLWVVDPGDDEDSLPDWYEEIASVSRDVVLAHGDEIPAIEDRLREVRVPCMTFAALADKHGVDHPDLILIDTEGHDAEVVRSIDVATTRPRMLVYEHVHLEEAEQSATREMLAGLGYRVIEEGFDTWCVDVAPDDRLSSLARRVEPGIPSQRSRASAAGA